MEEASDCGLESPNSRFVGLHVNHWSRPHSWVSLLSLFSASKIPSYVGSQPSVVSEESDGGNEQVFTSVGKYGVSFIFVLSS